MIQVIVAIEPFGWRRDEGGLEGSDWGEHSGGGWWRRLSAVLQGNKSVGGHESWVVREVIICPFRFLTLALQFRINNPCRVKSRDKQQTRQMMSPNTRRWMYLYHNIGGGALQANAH